MKNITDDLCFVGIDNDGYAQAVATAKSFTFGDDQSSFAFTGKATLMFQRESDEWDHSAFSSTPIIRFIDPMQGAPEVQDQEDEDFMRAVSDRVTFLHVPSQCQEMLMDDVWGIDCEFLMFAMPHPQDEGATAWLLIPGPDNRVIASRQTVQDYQFAELKNAAAALGFHQSEEPDQA